MAGFTYAFQFGTSAQHVNGRRHARYLLPTLIKYACISACVLSQIVNSDTGNAKTTVLPADNFGARGDGSVP